MQDHPLRQQMQANLAAFKPQLLEETDLKRASVAVVTTLDDTGKDPAFIVTRRASKLRGHAGQWAFPGGRLDPGETALEGAIREAQEELDLALSEANCLGQLDDYTTHSGYAISAFVFWITKARMRANPDEVAAIHHFEIASLDRPDSPELLPGPDPDRPIIRMHVGPVDIHAPTGAILHQFHEVAIKGRPTRVAHFDQPDWAR